MFKFKINGREYTIQEVSQAEIKKIQNTRRGNNKENINNINDRYYGITYTDVLKIYIDKDLPKERKKSTLIHELIHTYISEYITHINRQYSEEDVADICSNSFEIIAEIIENYSW